jgi:hypothetical protein
MPSTARRMLGLMRARRQAQARLTHRHGGIGGRGDGDAVIEACSCPAEGTALVAEAQRHDVCGRRSRVQASGRQAVAEDFCVGVETGEVHGLVRRSP